MCLSGAGGNIVARSSSILSKYSIHIPYEVNLNIQSNMLDVTKPIDKSRLFLIKKPGTHRCPDIGQTIRCPGLSVRSTANWNLVSNVPPSRAMTANTSVDGETVSHFSCQEPGRPSERGESFIQCLQCPGFPRRRGP